MSASPGREPDDASIMQQLHFYGRGIIDGLASIDKVLRERVVPLLENEYDDPVFDSTTQTGTSDAAQIRLDDRFHVDIHFETVGGNGTMTVEVSNDGVEWHQKDSQQINDGQNIFNYDIPWTHIRAHANQNLVKIEISSQRS